MKPTRRAVMAGAAAAIFTPRVQPETLLPVETGRGFMGMGPSNAMGNCSTDALLSYGESYFGQGLRATQFYSESDSAYGVTRTMYGERLLDTLPRISFGPAWLSSSYYSDDAPEEPSLRAELRAGTMLSPFTPRYQVIPKSAPRSLADSSPTAPARRARTGTPDRS